MADISYTPTTWADGAEGGTPIDAAKLNNIENGIVDAVAAIGPNDTTEDGTIKAQINALNASTNATIAAGMSMRECGAYVLITFSGYRVTNTGIGAAGNIGFIPAAPTSNAVMVEGVGAGLISILNDGTMTLYSETMGAYLTGPVHGSVFVLRA